MLRERCFTNATQVNLNRFSKNIKTVAHVHPEKLPLGVPVKQAKLKDVDALLKKHFGEEWCEKPDLLCYKNAIDRPVTVQGPVEDNPICEEQEEIPDLHI